MEFSLLSEDLLRKSGINVNSEVWEIMIKSHAEYPFMISLTDTLTELAIPFKLGRVSKEVMMNLDFPVLIGNNRSQVNNNMIEIVQSKFDLHNNNVLDRWDGMVLILEKNFKIANPSYLRKVNVLEKGKINKLVAICVAILASIYWSGIYRNLASLLFSFSAMIGFLILFLILKNKMGLSDSGFRKVCRYGQNLDCGRVLNFKFGKLSEVFSIEVAGLTYFSLSYTYSLFVFMNNSANGGIIFLLLQSSLACLAAASLLWIQWQIIGKWCILCLLVGLVLFLQLGILIYEYRSGNSWVGHTAYFYREFILFVVLGSGSYALACFIKFSAFRRRHSLTLEIENVRWKANYETFNFKLGMQLRVNGDDCMDDITFGSDAAKFKIIIALKPLCFSCADAFNKLLELVVEFSEETCLILKIISSSELERQVALNALKIYFCNFKKSEQSNIATKEKINALQDLFNSISGLKGNEKMSSSNKFEELLDSNNRWAVANCIIQSPTIYLNSYKVPAEYDYSDIVQILKRKIMN
jgi:uncharacterized membrane protein